MNLRRSYQGCNESGLRIEEESNQIGAVQFVQKSRMNEKRLEEVLEANINIHDGKDLGVWPTEVSEFLSR